MLYDCENALRSDGRAISSRTQRGLFLRVKALLIPILLAVFALQGAATVLGVDLDLRASVHTQACAGDAPDCEPAADSREVSAASEELSDYLPPVFSLARTHGRSSVRAIPVPAIASIDLPMHEPPPRA